MKTILGKLSKEQTMKKLVAIALLLAGCGGSGGDAGIDSSAQETRDPQVGATPAAPSNTNCYFDEETQVNLGEVGSEEGEANAIEWLNRRKNISINNCSGVVNVTIDNSTTTTSDSNNSEVAQSEN
jgi:hypothetical protein